MERLGRCYHCQEYRFSPLNRDLEKQTDFSMKLKIKEYQSSFDYNSCMLCEILIMFCSPSSTLLWVSSGLDRSEKGKSYIFPFSSLLSSYLSLEMNGTEGMYIYLDENMRCKQNCTFWNCVWGHDKRYSLTEGILGWGALSWELMFNK